MPKRNKRNGKGRSKSVNPRFTVDASTTNRESSRGNDTTHVSYCQVNFVAIGVPFINPEDGERRQKTGERRLWAIVYQRCGAGNRHFCRVNMSIAY